MEIVVFHLCREALLCWEKRVVKQSDADKEVHANWVNLVHECVMLSSRSTSIFLYFFFAFLKILNVSFGEFSMQSFSYARESHKN